MQHVSHDSEAERELADPADHLHECDLPCVNDAEGDQDAWDKCHEGADGHSDAGSCHERRGDNSVDISGPWREPAPPWHKAGRGARFGADDREPPSRAKSPSDDPRHESVNSDIEDEGSDDGDETEERSDSEASEHPEDHDDKEDAGTCCVLMLFSCGVFGVSCSADHKVKGTVVRAIPTSSDDFGDLKDDHRWQVMLGVMRDEVVDAVLMTPPTETFMDQDAEFNEGLRDATGSGWFGRPGIGKKCIDDIKGENLLWYRSAEAAKAMEKLGRRWAILGLRHGEVTPLAMTCYTELLDIKTVGRADIRIGGLSFILVYGGWQYRQEAYNDMEDLYVNIVRGMSTSRLENNDLPRRGDEPEPLARRRMPGWRQQLNWVDRVKPQPWDKEEEPVHIGGLRDIRLSLDKVPIMRQQGAKIGRELEALFERQPETLRALLEAVKTRSEDVKWLEPHVQNIVDVVSEVIGCANVSRGVEQGLHCEVRPYFIKALREYTGDPDSEVEKWFVDGAPLGIEEQPVDCNIFPKYPDDGLTEDPANLASEELQGKTQLR